MKFYVVSAEFQYYKQVYTYVYFRCGVPEQPDILNWYDSHPPPHSDVVDIISDIDEKCDYYVEYCCDFTEHNRTPHKICANSHTELIEKIKLTQNTTGRFYGVKTLKEHDIKKIYSLVEQLPDILFGRISHFYEAGDRNTLKQLSCSL